MVQSHSKTRMFGIAAAVSWIVIEMTERECEEERKRETEKVGPRDAKNYLSVSARADSHNISP